MQSYLKTTTDFEVHAPGLDLFNKFNVKCTGARKNHADYVLRKASDETENGIWKFIWQTVASTPALTEAIDS